MIKRMAKVSIDILMAHSTEAIGKRTSSTDVASRHGPMEPVSKETTTKGKNMDKEFLHGLTVAPTPANSLWTILKDMVSALSPLIQLEWAPKSYSLQTGLQNKFDLFEIRNILSREYY